MKHSMFCDHINVGMTRRDFFGKFALGLGGIALSQLLPSGNDAAVAIAERLAGSEETFAQLMTQQARALGMKNSSFANATGLPDPSLFTTARDMAILSRALISDFPQY